MSSTSTEHHRDGSPASAISNLVVRLMSDYTGRGPTKARTYMNDNLITVLLQDTLTKGERSLVRNGKEDLVLSTRLAFQMTMREDLQTGLERITGRTVRAFMSSNHMDPDVAVEVFVLDEIVDGDSAPAARGDGIGSHADQT
jgi:uncharacterized protein YbcI